MLHSYPWYPQDWRTSEAVLSMSAEARDVYRNLLDACWMDGDLPIDERVLRKLALAEPAEWRRAWPIVRQQFQERDSRLHHPKVDERRPELERWHNERTEAGRRGGLAKAKLQAQLKLNGSSSASSSATSSAKPQPVAQLKPSTSTSIVPPPEPPPATCHEPATPPEDQRSGAWESSVDYADIVARMMDAHPRKDGLRLAEQQLAEIISSAVNPAAVAAQIEQTHARWSKTDGWTRENGRYCPKLANWLAKAGYLDQPPSAPESVPVYRRPPEERGDY